ncbi:hypothetical protein BKA07_000739 [Brevibacterium marinum]|uniref:Uncharacterized protein n=1 Tax=Brevibacterium marinum TaxID=418643 RepID=A0A846RP70_9MICO|nr:hypothetical protein [Brevibacterium marinum]
MGKAPKGSDSSSKPQSSRSARVALLPEAPLNRGLASIPLSQKRKTASIGRWLGCGGEPWDRRLTCHPDTLRWTTRGVGRGRRGGFSRWSTLADESAPSGRVGALKGKHPAASSRSRSSAGPAPSGDAVRLARAQRSRHPPGPPTVGIHGPPADRDLSAEPLSHFATSTTGLMFAPAPDVDSSCSSRRAVPHRVVHPTGRSSAELSVDK